MSKLLEINYYAKDHHSGSHNFQLTYNGEEPKAFDVTCHGHKKDMMRVLVRNNLFDELTEVLSVAIDNAWDNKEDLKRLKSLQMRCEKGE